MAARVSAPEEGQAMRAAVVVLMVVVLGCAAAPMPKAPDESRRTPVNKVVPQELRARRP
jgi:hypothetical protein